MHFSKDLIYCIYIYLCIKMYICLNYTKICNTYFVFCHTLLCHVARLSCHSDFRLALVAPLLRGSRRCKATAICRSSQSHVGRKRTLWRTLKDSIAEAVHDLGSSKVCEFFHHFLPHPKIRSKLMMVHECDVTASPINVSLPNAFEAI